MDCYDVFCLNTTLCQGGGGAQEICENGKDDDDDNLIDCNDMDCKNSITCGGQGSSSQLQQYPTMNLEATVDTKTKIGGDEIAWEVEYTYTTFATDYPGATLNITVALPDGFEFVRNSDDHDGEGVLDDVEDNDDELLFTITIDPKKSPSSTKTDAKTYEGTIMFETATTNKAVEGSNTISLELLCYDMDDSGKQKLGAKTCSPDGESSAVKADSAKATIYLEDDGTVSDDQRGKNDLDDNNTDSCRRSGLEKTFCSDGKDNDCDGKKDCSDSDCNDTSYCKTHGSAEKACGDGTIQPAEQCDDGNDKNNDGCSTTCTIEDGRNCS